MWDEADTLLPLPKLELSWDWADPSESTPADDDDELATPSVLDTDTDSTSEHGDPPSPAEDQAQRRGPRVMLHRLPSTNPWTVEGSEQGETTDDLGDERVVPPRVKETIQGRRARLPRRAKRLQRCQRGRARTRAPPQSAAQTARAATLSPISRQSAASTLSAPPILWHDWAMILPPLGLFRTRPDAQTILRPHQMRPTPTSRALTPPHTNAATCPVPCLVPAQHGTRKQKPHEMLPVGRPLTSGPSSEQTSAAVSAPEPVRGRDVDLTEWLNVE